jgi:hypothetical protein
MNAAVKELFDRQQAVAGVWSDVDPAEGVSVWFHPDGMGRKTNDRQEALDWARETSQKPEHFWVL